MPRGAYKKKAQNILNVRARHELLLNGIRAPASVDKAVRDGLIGQRAFAALALPRRNIAPMALNTVKSLSDEIFTRPDEVGRVGFKYLDALRIRLNGLVDAVVVGRDPVAKTARAENKIEQLQTRLIAAELQGVKRQRAYLSLFAALNGLIKDVNMPVEAQHRLYRLLENHHAAFSDLFEPSIPDPQIAKILSGLNKSK